MIASYQAGYKNPYILDSTLIGRVIISSIPDRGEIIPKGFELKQNYPNPFNPITNIEYSIPKNTHINISIYNLLGQMIKQLVSKPYQPGYYKVNWDGTNYKGNRVSTGMYFYKIQTEYYIKIKKMILMN